MHRCATGGSWVFGSRHGGQAPCVHAPCWQRSAASGRHLREHHAPGSHTCGPCRYRHGASAHAPEWRRSAARRRHVAGHCSAARVVGGCDTSSSQSCRLPGSIRSFQHEAPSKRLQEPSGECCCGNCCRGAASCPPRAAVAWSAAHNCGSGPSAGGLCSGDGSRCGPVDAHCPPDGFPLPRAAGAGPGPFGAVRRAALAPQRGADQRRRPWRHACGRGRVARCREPEPFLGA
mmetsp:Transcript_20054/g.62727  ORF Transcript_20054/g.62727 Transcript_20054/m.62727 type:complete len:232 (+) Transcript_20054:550-1245(+)